MLLVACAVVFELCLAAVLWRLARERPSIASQIATVFIGFAGAFSLGLATQGFLLFAVGIIRLSELAPTMFWLTSGGLAFAVALALRPSPGCAALPSLIVAALAFGFGIVRQETLGAVIGAALVCSAGIMFWCARSIARPRAPEPCNKDGPRLGIAERAQ